MSESSPGAFGAPLDAEGTRCCVCDGPLLFRGRPFKPHWRSWFTSSARLMDEASYDHAVGCEASLLPAASLIGMDRRQALAEAARRRGSADGDPPPAPPR
ncbi:hypothetical protein ABZ920_19430 [Streptomyces sp. NPDC046831]|uniref:hypothetical protein n=1 Tax=Streptomyces sp. NPDC046831 TaxID=3154805 RepID=UPI00340D6C70